MPSIEMMTLRMRGMMVWMRPGKVPLCMRMGVGMMRHSCINNVAGRMGMRGCIFAPRGRRTKTADMSSLLRGTSVVVGEPGHRRVVVNFTLPRDTKVTSVLRMMRWVERRHHGRRRGALAEAAVNAKDLGVPSLIFRSAQSLRVSYLVLGSPHRLGTFESVQLIHRDAGQGSE